MPYKLISCFNSISINISSTFPSKYSSNCFKISGSFIIKLDKARVSITLLGNTLNFILCLAVVFIIIDDFSYCSINSSSFLITALIFILSPFLFIQIIISCLFQFNSQVLLFLFHIPVYQATRTYSVYMLRHLVDQMDSHLINIRSWHMPSQRNTPYNRTYMHLILEFQFLDSVHHRLYEQA